MLSQLLLWGEKVITILFGMPYPALLLNDPDKRQGYIQKGFLGEMKTDVSHKKHYLCHNGNFL